jgi:cation diffusion facilitator family transporter
LVSDVVTYVTFNKARTPKSQKFPYGYGRLETLGAFSVSAILSVGAMGMAYHSYEALLSLISQEAHVHTHLTMHPWALGLAAMSVVVKEVLFHSTMKIGKKIKSDLIIANAWHHRSDSATSLVALISIAGAVVHPSLMFLDPVGGILVSALVFKAGLDSGIPAFKELIEASMAEDVNTRIAHQLNHMMVRYCVIDAR